MPTLGSGGYSVGVIHGGTATTLRRVSFTLSRVEFMIVLSLVAPFPPSVTGEILMAVIGWGPVVPFYGCQI